LEHRKIAWEDEHVREIVELAEGEFLRDFEKHIKEISEACMQWIRTGQKNIELMKGIVSSPYFLLNRK
jgi:hypothetical protein